MNESSVRGNRSELLAADDISSLQQLQVRQKTAPLLTAATGSDANCECHLWILLLLLLYCRCGVLLNNALMRVVHDNSDNENECNEWTTDGGDDMMCQLSMHCDCDKKMEEQLNKKRQ